MSDSIARRLGALRVGDVMSQPVEAIETHRTMGEAGSALLAWGVTGAPVVDDQGHCVGMLTATDFMRYERSRADVEPPTQSPKDLAERPSTPMFFDEAEYDRVEKHMTRGLQTVAADAPLLNAAKMLSETHLHHLPVLDPQGRPVGMVSSLDVVAALLGAIDENLPPA